MTTLCSRGLLDEEKAAGMVSAFKEVVKSIPLLSGAKSQTEYAMALELIEYLVDHDAIDTPLFELLAAKIAQYESHAPAFGALKQALDAVPPGAAVLRTLMDQYGLKAADLEAELGSKSNVSNILSGRRALTVQHIKALSARFHLPAEMFIQ